MTLQEINTLLAEFDGFDGAVIQSLTFHSEATSLSRQVRLVLRAFHSPQGGDKGWKLVSIVAIDRAIFGWIESPLNTNLVLNYPVIVLAHDDRLIIDLDPLHQVESLPGIRLSSFFIGGCCVSVSISPIPD